MESSPLSYGEQARSKPPISCFVRQAIARATLSQMLVRTAIPPQACYPAGNSSRESLVDRSYANSTASSSPAIPHHMVTTAFTLDGFNIVRNIGLVRGIIVRSRSIVGTLGATLQTIVGGNITLLTNLCEETREHAFDLMLQHAAELGANAVIGMRYDATEVMQGATEVLAYGTAVWVERKT
jgi:uncharacterized protein YbjQ (UPF0145 family)